MEALHASQAQPWRWVPGQASIRPNPEILQAKRERQEQEQQHSHDSVDIDQWSNDLFYDTNKLNPSSPPANRNKVTWLDTRRCFEQRMAPELFKNGDALTSDQARALLERLLRNVNKGDQPQQPQQVNV
jgi:hypothetical protein